MNIENINERLLRTERERDEARAEVEKIKAREAEGVALFDSLLARERAELARLRAAANERAIAELECQRDRLAEACHIIGRSYDVCDAASPLWSCDCLNKRIRALRAETPAPVPPPVTPPADAPSRPSVKALMHERDTLRRDIGNYDRDAIVNLRTAVKLLLDDALAGRGEGAK